MSDVPGWLSLASEEGERLVDEASVSTKIWKQYEGCGLSLPTPSVRYDIETVLYVVPPHTFRAAMDETGRAPNFQKLLDDFYARALDAFRALTAEEEFVLALDCESGRICSAAHRAVDDAPWPLRVPGPEAFYTLYTPPDYSWVSASAGIEPRSSGDPARSVRAEQAETPLDRRRGRRSRAAEATDNARAEASGIPGDRDTRSRRSCS